MNVNVYTTSTCPWCQRVKEYLRQNNVTFTEYNVAKDKTAAMEMIKKSGQRGVPVIDINDEIIVGFDKNSIDKLLGL